MKNSVTDYSSGRFPIQTLPYRSKGEKWRKACVDWAADKSYFNYSPIRRNTVKMKINYDLINGKVRMSDMEAVLNPNGVVSIAVPEKVVHYPIINSKLNVLRGEEGARTSPYRVVITNPNAVSEIEKEKKRLFDQRIQQIVQDPSLSEEEAAKQAEDTQYYFNYTYKDIRELQANELLRHYSMTQNFKQTFNDGFMDALICNTEIYMCGIEGGEPVLRKVNPLKLRTFRSGYSNRIEDSDVIIYEDYWSPGRIIDAYYDELTTKDIKKLSDELPDFGGNSPLGAAGNYNDAYGFRPVADEDGVLLGEGMTVESVIDSLAYLDGGEGSDLLPYDVAGNVRVIKVWWKSRRKILEVKSFDPVTGEEELDFYPETYVPDESAGEVANTLWVNEMWEGTKIGDDIYVGIRPCLVQHNSIANPSRCHAGIIGTIYNINESQPYSLVDMMKPYNYLYDAIHAKLIDMIATNWGKLLELDLALKPAHWEVDKWLYFARANKVLVRDSFKEGDKGAATGKLAGSLNNASKGYIDADWGQSIQNYMNILEWTKESMSDLVGINRQREGSTYSRETVGGIERAVLQSSYITDWIFQQHEDTRKRVLECFIEEAQGALRGRTKVFQYELSDGSRKIMEIDGDDFCMHSFGLVVDNSAETQKLDQSLDALVNTALQQGYNLSTIAKMYRTSSLSDKVRMLEKAERERLEQQNQQAQQQAQQQQAQLQADQQSKMMELQLKDSINQRDNETKLKVADINARAEYLRLGMYAEENDPEIREAQMKLDNDRLKEEIRQFDKELRFREEELDVKKQLETKKIEASKVKSKVTAKSK